MMMILKSVR